MPSGRWATHGSRLSHRDARFRFVLARSGDSSAFDFKNGELWQGDDERPGKEGKVRPRGEEQNPRSQNQRNLRTNANTLAHIQFQEQWQAGKSSPRVSERQGVPSLTNAQRRELTYGHLGRRVREGINVI